MQTIPQRLKKVRAALGYTSWQQLGERMNYDRSYLGDVAKGKKEAGDRLVREIEALERQIESGLAGEMQNSQQPERLVVRDDEPHDPARHLRTLREGRGLSIEELAKLSKVGGGHIREMEDGRVPISESVFTRLKRALPRLDREIMFAGSETPRTIDPTGLRGARGDAPTIGVPPGSVAYMVPELSWAQAGRFHDFSDEAFGHESVPVVDISDRKAFALVIRGDSMEPKIAEGDRVIVCPSWQPYNGDTVVCRTADGDVMCKLYQSKGGGRVVVLSSHNQAYPPMELSREEIAWVYPVADVMKRLRRE